MPIGGIFTMMGVMMIKRSLKYSFFLSLLVHLAMMGAKIPLPALMSIGIQQNETPPKIIRLRLRRLGAEDAKERNNVYARKSQDDTNVIKDLKAFSNELVKTNMDTPNQTQVDKIQIVPAQSKKNKSVVVKVFNEDNIIHHAVQTKDGYNVETIGKFETQTQTPILSNSTVNLNLDVPKGVNFEQLNEFEKQLYSFNLRVQKTFQTALFRQFAKFIDQNPHFPQILLNRSERLTGKLTYDKNGNLLRIKTIKGSYYEKLQEAFLNSLQDVSILPNIPEIVLNDKDQMNLNVTININ